MCGLGHFVLLSQCIDVLVDTFLGSVKKHNFLINACLSLFCSVFAFMAIDLVPLATHDPLMVVKPKTQTFVQNEQAHQEFLERVFKQPVLGQSGFLHGLCWTKVFLWTIY